VEGQKRLIKYRVLRNGNRIRGILDSCLKQRDKKPLGDIESG